jgi:hypothetical protein
MGDVDFMGMKVRQDVYDEFIDMDEIEEQQFLEKFEIFARGGDPDIPRGLQTLQNIDQIENIRQDMLEHYRGNLQAEKQWDKILKASDKHKRELLMKKLGFGLAGAVGLSAIPFIADNEDYDEDILNKHSTNVDDEGVKTMIKFAEIVEETYKAKQGAKIQDSIDGFTPTITDSDLITIWEKDDKAIFAIRGIDFGSEKKELLQMATKSFFTATDEEDFGTIYKKNLDEVEKILLDYQSQNPDKTIILSGHSRGGRLSLNLGRKYDLETRAFNPATNFREDERDYNHDVSKIHTYMTKRDLVPKYQRAVKKLNEENNYVVKNYNFIKADLPHHSLGYFTDENNIIQVRRHGKQIDDLQKRIRLESQSGEYISGEDYVDSDLGNFDGVLEGAATPFIAKPFIPNNFDVDTLINPPKNLTYGEFERRMANKKMRKKRIKELFDKLDVDGNGLLSPDELARG